MCVHALMCAPPCTRGESSDHREYESSDRGCGCREHGGVGAGIGGAGAVIGGVGAVIMGDVGDAVPIVC